MGKEFSQVTEKYTNQGLTLEQLFSLNIRPSRVQSVLIDLVQTMMDKKDIGGLLLAHETDRFTAISPLGQKEILYLTNNIYKEVPDNYTDVDLSPVVPLGTNSILTEVSQKSILSTIRKVEVLADPTTALVLECAKRRKLINRGSSSTAFVYNLCTSAKCIRGQVFSGESGFEPHFQVFAMANGGISTTNEMDLKPVEHLSTYVNFIKKISGYTATDISVEISNINIAEEIIKYKKIDRREVGEYTRDKNFDFFEYTGVKLPSRIPSLNELDGHVLEELKISRYIQTLKKMADALLPLKVDHPEISFHFNLARIAGIGYYNGVCFKITANNSHGVRFPLADGGYSNWLAKLLSNGKIQYFSSGFGTELFGKFFKA